MANLAIKGHATRGREVIELLKILGGKIRKDRLEGNEIFSWYYINWNGYIDYKHYSLFDGTIVFTLEEFLEKFPFKVGDKIKFEYYPYTIQSMEWDGSKEEILYTVKGDDFCKCVYAADLQPYKEETMDRKYNVEEYLKVWEETEKGLEVVVNDRFELKEDNGKFYIIKKQSQYPKTYEECLEILGYNISHTIPMNHGHQGILMMRFQRLHILRDAYWKIAGEQQGLGRPWEPDWKSSDLKYVIKTIGGEICKSTECTINCFLAFPTEEMRDAFFENFKDLIEECKELI